MAAPRSNDPLHGITLEQIVTRLAGELGWAELGRRIPVRCFLFDPSVLHARTGRQAHSSRLARPRRVATKPVKP